VRTAASLSLAVALTLASSAALADKFECKSAGGLSPYQAAPSAIHDHDRFSPRISGIAKEFAAYVGVFDDADDDDGDGSVDLLANPVFVAYELQGVERQADGTFAEPDVSIDRPDDWYKTPEFAFLWANRAGVTKKRLDNSYDGIGNTWNRGHLAMSDHAQRIGAEAACNTHHFWNASPQAKDLNQGPWRHLETYTAAASNKFGGVWVITGPIFDVDKPRLTIGDAGEVPIAVPQAFFKIVVRETVDGVDALGFVFEQPSKLDSGGKPAPEATWVNCNRANSLNHTYDHTDRLRSIRTIEERTGLIFFPDLSEAARSALIDATPAKLWTVEPRFWDAGSACAGQTSHP
jgi:DNA/RNA endonuclease G (NUC1)